MSTSEPEHETHNTQAVKDLSDSQVRQYLRKFYYISNDISLDKEWGDLFTEDGVYIMGNKKAKGPEAIRKLRKKLFEDIPSRDHSPIKIFSHGNHDDDTELMILGTVGWTYHAGHGHEGDWAAHVKLHKGEDGMVRCAYYQIICVSILFLVKRGGWKIKKREEKGEGRPLVMDRC
ncbi:MAG: hypothetical protein Q9204_007412 [Flavoplaca sp. TL-2023a]